MMTYSFVTVLMNTTLLDIDNSGKTSNYYSMRSFMVHNVSSGFIQVPRSLNVAVNEVAVFNCEHSASDGIVWRINGTNSRDLPGFGSTIFESISGRSHALSITAIAEYNSTQIKCVALFTDSYPIETRIPAELVIQGQLKAGRLIMHLILTMYMH